MSHSRFSCPIDVVYGWHDVVLYPIYACSPQQMEHCLEGAQLVFDAANKKLSGDNIVILQKAARSLVGLMLYLMDKVSSVQSSEVNQEAAHKKKGSKQAIKMLLSQLLQRDGVIGGPFFGGNGRRTDKEIKVAVYITFRLVCYCNAPPLQLWQYMLELKCPPSVEEDWQEVVNTIVEDRVARLSKEASVNLLCELENHTNAPDLLTNIFMTKAAEALDELIFKVSAI